MQITPAILKRIAPTAKAARLKAISDAAPRVLTKYGITTRLRMAHFFAQLAHESGDFNIGRENTNYSAKNLAKIWDTGNWHGYFSSRSEMMKMAGRGEDLLNIVYGNRMGNGPPSSGDGYRYRGGGLAQITGKDGYASMQAITGFKLVANPAAVFDDDKMLEVAAAFWRWKKLQPLADADDMLALAMKWNGARKASSIIGLAERKAKLALAKKVFTEDLDEPVARLVDTSTADDAQQDSDQDQDEEQDREEDLEVSPPDAAEEEASESAVEPGAKGDPDLYSVQRRVKALNYSPGLLDGKWGGGSSGAIAGIINDRGMSITPPKSMAGFKAVLIQLKAGIAAAEADTGPDGKPWKRPVTAARAAADPKVVAEIAPEVVPAKRSLWAIISGTVLTFLSAIWNTITSWFDWAWSLFSDHKDDIPTEGGFMSTAWEYIQAVPHGVWWTVAVAVGVALAWNAHNAVKKINTAVQTGARQ